MIHTSREPGTLLPVHTATATALAYSFEGVGRRLREWCGSEMGWMGWDGMGFSGRGLQRSMMGDGDVGLVGLTQSEFGGERVHYWVRRWMGKQMNKVGAKELRFT